MNSTLRARSVYDLSGNEIRSGITIDKSDILQHDPFDKCLDKEEDGEFMTIKVAWSISSTGWCSANFDSREPQCMRYRFVYQDSSLSDCRS